MSKLVHNEKMGDKHEWVSL